ncbi:hypothetical protein HanXRQr2_Chr09g0408031 [Helianthus annuus]|uniref:Uncharacterized protein n=1 Tax=Helianthus annuus TaxID=4232 RepID=A0A251TYW7_HELAN|nr:hypothetical protein HanXRQr2_Chr09g0408031 [Helianthus annuus]
MVGMLTVRRWSTKILNSGDRFGYCYVVSLAVHDFERTILLLHAHHLSHGYWEYDGSSYLHLRYHGDKVACRACCVQVNLVVGR